MAVVGRRPRQPSDPTTARHRKPARHAAGSPPAVPQALANGTATASHANATSPAPAAVVNGAAVIATARPVAIRPNPAAPPATPATRAPGTKTVARRTRAQPAPVSLSPAGVVLPSPPRDAEKFAYVRRHVWVLTLSTVLTFPPLVFSQIRMFQDSHWFLFYAPFMLFGTLCFALSLGIDGMSKPFDLAEHKRVVAMWRPLWYPSVDVFMPTCGEPIEVLRNTWTYVDGLSDELQRPGHHLRPRRLGEPGTEGDGPRIRLRLRHPAEPGLVPEESGNLLYGYQISEGEFILLLDADFAPRLTFSTRRFRT